MTWRRGRGRGGGVLGGKGAQEQSHVLASNSVCGPGLSTGALILHSNQHSNVGPTRLRGHRLLHEARLAHLEVEGAQLEVPVGGRALKEPAFGCMFMGCWGGGQRRVTRVGGARRRQQGRRAAKTRRGATAHSKGRPSVAQKDILACGRGVLKREWAGAHRRRSLAAAARPRASRARARGTRPSAGHAARRALGHAREVTPRRADRTPSWNVPLITSDEAPPPWLAAAAGSCEYLAGGGGGGGGGSKQGVLGLGARAVGEARGRRGEGRPPSAARRQARKRGARASRSPAAAPPPPPPTPIDRRQRRVGRPLRLDGGAAVLADAGLGGGEARGRACPPAGGVRGGGGG